MTSYILVQATLPNYPYFTRQQVAMACQGKLQRLLRCYINSSTDNKYSLYVSSCKLDSTGGYMVIQNIQTFPSCWTQPGSWPLLIKTFFYSINRSWTQCFELSLCIFLELHNFDQSNPISKTLLAILPTNAYNISNLEERTPCGLFIFIYNNWA